MVPCQYSSSSSLHHLAILPLDLLLLILAQYSVVSTYVRD